MEGATHRSQIDQTEQEQRLYSQESSQAHLQIVDRDKYSKIPKFPAAKKRAPRPRKEKGPMRRSQKVGKDVHYKTKKFEAAKISIKKEVLFDPSVLSLTADSLDFYLGRYLARSPRNRARIALGSSQDKLIVRISNTGFTERGKPSSKTFSWTVGHKGPGRQFFQADPDEVQTLLDRLCHILERLEPIEFSGEKGTTGRGHFLRCIFNRLIRHANPAFKLRAVSDGYYYTSWNGSSLQMSTMLYGFNCQPSSIDCYSTEIVTQVSRISLKPLNIPFEDRYRDREAIDSYDISDSDPSRSSELQRQLQHIKTSDQKPRFENAQKLSQKLLYTLDGFDGPKLNLKRLACGIKDAHCMVGSSGRTLLGLYGDGYVMWYLIMPGNASQSRLEPSP